MSLAVASSNFCSYTAAWKEYFTFCEKEGLGHDWPASDDNLMQFVVHLHRKGLSPRSIQGRMSALAFYAKMQGCKGFTIYFRLRKMIKGWSRERGVTGDTRTLISTAILAKLGGT